MPYTYAIPVIYMYLPLIQGNRVLKQGDMFISYFKIFIICIFTMFIILYNILPLYVIHLGYTIFIYEMLLLFLNIHLLYKIVMVITSLIIINFVSIN